LLPQLSTPKAGASDPNLSTLIDELKREMQKPSPSRKLVSEHAQTAIARLGRWQEQIAQSRFTAERGKELLRSLAKDEPGLAQGSWDRAAQLYLALSALYHANGDLDPGRRDALLKEALTKLGKTLEFPRGSPAAPYQDSPGAFDFKSVREQLKTIQQQLGH
jgi:hypothetical protein